ncbi:MAG TPA: restriction endonuclease subunit S [Methanothrix sp.]|nr:restriction endonuclease subunit S [Methanothrix sp.]HPJ85102.1 restriction endonuclease subunit S [Methanothrix sp.]
MTTTSPWSEVHFGEIAEFRNGLNFTKENFGKGIKVIGVSDFQDYTVPKYDELSEINPDGVVKKSDYLEEGDILFVRSNGNRSLIGRSLFIRGIKESISHSAFTIKARITSDKALPQFYAYLFRTQLIRETLSAYGGGTNINNLNQRILNDILVPLPPLPTQRKIAAVLSAYDDLIENNTRRIKILEEMAQALYREWFVNFRFPGHEKVRMEDSELGPKPEGWEVKTLGEVCDIVMGQSPKSEFYNEEGEGLPFHQGVTDFGKIFPTTRVYCTIKNRIAESGDILFSVRAPVGRINIADRKIVIGRGLSSIRSKDETQVFYFQQLKYTFQEEDMIGGGTIFKSVTKADMHRINVLIPSHLLVSEFERIAKSMFYELKVLTAKNDVLRRTRDLLLPKLISGEIDVEGLEIKVGGLEA